MRKRIIHYGILLVVIIVVNFFLPRLLPGSPVGTLLGDDPGAMPVSYTHLDVYKRQLLVLSGIHKLVQVESEQSSKEEPQKESAEEREIFSDSSKALRFQGK